MPSVPHEFVTVEMRGLKAALIVRSHADRVSVSSLVRSFVARGLGHEDIRAAIESLRSPASTARVKLSIRMLPAEVRQFSSGARTAGLSQAAYLAELIAGAPELVASSTRSGQLAALVAANAELSTLRRNVLRLAQLLGQGSVHEAKAYRGLLDTIAGDVRRHLSLASAVLAELRGRRMPMGTARGRST